MKAVVILASSRSYGNTAGLSDDIANRIDADLIDLNQYKIQPYSYVEEYEDDFVELIKRMVKVYDTFIFATPVYWYSMSGVLKVFFDRFTDLITLYKDLGRELGGKSVYVITTSSGDHLGDQFWLPFQKTFNYLNMSFKGGYHFLNNLDIDFQIEIFLKENKIKIQ